MVLEDWRWKPSFRSYWRCWTRPRRWVPCLSLVHLTKCLPLTAQHTLVTEIRELILPEDRQRYDELVYRRSSASKMSSRMDYYDTHRVSAASFPLLSRRNSLFHIRVTFHSFNLMKHVNAERKMSHCYEATSASQVLASRLPDVTRIGNHLPPRLVSSATSHAIWDATKKCSLPPLRYHKSRLCLILPFASLKGLHDRETSKATKYSSQSG